MFSVEQLVANVLLKPQYAHIAETVKKSPPIGHQGSPYFLSPTQIGSGGLTIGHRVICDLVNFGTLCWHELHEPGSKHRLDTLFPAPLVKCITDKTEGNTSRLSTAWLDWDVLSLTVMWCMGNNLLTGGHPQIQHYFYNLVSMHVTHRDLYEAETRALLIQE